MNKIVLVMLQAFLAVGLAACFSPTAKASSMGQPKPNAITFFDVSDLPARIDEPRLSRNSKGSVIDCAVANRSGEQLLGIRLILLVIDPGGRLRSRITWTERIELPMYSIKTSSFHPEIPEDLRPADRIFLGIDEVFGHETIWLADGAEKGLRAYARGQHDVVPRVRTLVNKYDRPELRALPLFMVPPRKE